MENELTIYEAERAIARSTGVNYKIKSPVGGEVTLKRDVNDGRKQRNLIDHFENFPHGAYLYEVHPWSWPRNVENIEQT